MEEKVIKAYKGLGKDMKCRNFQYEEGKEYETDKAKCCDAGFHACENPIDVLKYYEPGSSIYREVECSGDIDKSNDDSKFACTKIKIGAKIDIPLLCKATFDYVKSKCTNENNAEAGKPATAGYAGAATAGNRGAATAGEYGAATAGEYGAATAGNRGAATAGYAGAATAGYAGAATAGNAGAATAGNAGAATAGYAGAATAGEYGAATAGNRGAATAGNRGAATAGNRGAATSRGSVKVGENGIGCVRGSDVNAMGGLGAVLMIAVENDYNYDIKEWKAVVVDGERIKADTWYKLVDGEFTEVE